MFGAACSVTSPAGQTRGAFGAAGSVEGRGTVADARLPRFVPLAPVMRADVELLTGHPDSAGRPFVMRIHELAGTVIPAHRHPVDEHLTVVRGRIRFGTGAAFDSAALRELGPGDYAFLPAGTVMFGVIDDDAVVQVHGTGPFHIHWLDGLVVLGEAGSATTFTFRKGELVETARGPGVILEGYASGALVQYVVQRADSTRYMAHQAELRRR